MAVENEFRVRMQLAEALSPMNRWYCAQAHRREIDDPEVLLRYYIKSGGAADFAARYRNATSRENRWHCSEFHRREIHNLQILWDYYMNRAEGQRSH